MPRLPEGYTIDQRGNLVPKVQANPREISVRRFMGRLSLTEQIALTAIRINPDTPLEVRAQLETIKDLRDGTTNKMINQDDPDTRAGQELVLYLLSQLPEGTPGRIDPTDFIARLDAWRADYPQPGEPT